MSEVATKVCTKCKVEKEVKYFPLRKDSPDGYRNDCKACKKMTDRSYYLNNPEEVKKRAKAWRIKNIDKVRASANVRMKRYYRANPDKFKQKAKEYRNNNLEVCKQRSKAYRAKNKEHCAVKSRAWKKANKERNAENAKRWYYENHEKAKAINKENNKRYTKDQVAYWHKVSEQRAVKNLNDSYVKNLLRNRGFSRELRNNPEIISTYAAIIKFKRVLKNNQHGKESKTS